MTNIENDFGISDRSLIWNSDLMEALEASVEVARKARQEEGRQTG